MHIPDGLLSPAVCATTGLVAAAGLGYGLHRLNREHAERTTVLMGVMASFVFAAQMVNFPVGPGVSGHLIGGALAAVMLGPWAGAVVLAVVLVAQCLAFGDGGITALGANFLNLGLIGAVGGHAIYAPLARLLGGRKGVLIAAMVAAWFSVILASAALALEIAASGRLSELPRALAWLTLVHAAIGLGEAIITGLILRFVLLTRPDFIPGREGTAPTRGARLGQVALAGLGIGLAIAVFLSPLASSSPDGLEFVGAKLGLEGAAAAPVLDAPILDYELPGVPKHLGLATAAAGFIGTLLVFAVGIALARSLSPGPHSRDSVPEVPAGHAA